jgi:glycosyltransferase involved in cell wall biosynthesis
MLRQLADDLRLANVRFAGRVNPSTINEYYADHDIYMQSPDIDNMPLSMLEAFASGLPVVSTEAGGIPTMLEHGRHGLLAPLDDHRALAAHVMRLLDDPDFARLLARAAHLTCNDYAWPSVREKWLDVYESVLSTPKAEPAPASGQS